MASRAYPSRPTVLVVEDSEDFAETLQMLISDVLGYETLRAASAEEAWAVLGRRRVHLLVTDHRLVRGGLTGLELAACARAADPALPVVMVSADPPEGAAAVCDRVFRKPANPAALLEAIARLAASCRRARRACGPPRRPWPGLSAHPR